MKFGSKIKDALYSEWQKYYVDYSGLKKFIKERQEDHEWNDTDEEEFVATLSGELDKVVKFQEAKIAEIKTQINEYEEEVEALIREANGRERRAPGNAEDTEANPAEGMDEDDDVDSFDGDVIEDRFVHYEEDLANIIADVHDMGHFSHLNYTGFIKIVKKHDKRTHRELRGPFIRDFLAKRPFYKENYDTVIVELSKLYNLVRTRGHPVKGDASAGGNQSAFVRQTTKYWVHKDNWVQLKLVILKHLPVLVFNTKKEFEPEDAAISSIYFDNENLDLYMGRLEKTEGAEAIRLRWYGGMGVKQIFVERKTHREDWTGEKSVKARFPIDESKVNAYIKGEYTMDADFRELAKKGKSQKEIDSMTRLASEVQHSILTKKLHPVMRTFYNRTAFQLPGDARVRISFDTELSLIREDNWDGRTRSGDNWRRMDIGIDYPFDQLPDDDKHLFPYGVLEVKLQTQYGQEPPEWVRELVTSHLVEAVPKFSKFIHGCATLIPNRVDLVPFWLPQMETDIRKPATNKAQIDRPSHSHETSSHASSNHGATPTQKAPDASAPDGHDWSRYTEPISDDEDDDHNRHRAIPSNEAAVAGVDPKRFDEARKQRNSVTSHDEAARPKKPTDNTVFPKLTKDNLAKLLNRESAPPGADTPNGVEYVSSFRPPDGKRISVPVRVEPKVYFANERTMLSWLSISITLSAIGIGLLTFSDPSDDAALAGAVFFTGVALLSIIYTAATYRFRVLAIRSRLAISYHDYYGPTVLCAVLFLALLVNLIVKYRSV